MLGQQPNYSMPKGKKKSADKTAAKKGDADKKPKRVKSEKAVKAKPAAKKASSSKKALPVSPSNITATITIEEISMRAYFIAERRQAMGWPGDSDSDWVEAERQLKAETALKSKGQIL